MKVFISDDNFEQDSQKVFVVRRQNPKSPPSPQEMPIQGEEVMLDGVKCRIASTELTRDAGAVSWPCVLLTVIAK